MTITPLTVYVILQSDQIRLGVILLALCYAAYRATLAVLGFTVDFALQAEIEREKLKQKPDQSKIDAASGKRSTAAVKTKANLKSAAIWFVASVCAMAVIPKTKTLAGAWLAPAIANSQAVQKDFPELYNLAVEKLKEQLTPAK